MANKNGCCQSCTAPCAGGFKKVVDLEYSGLVIYLHTKKDEKIKPPSRYDDSYVLHNTSSKELKKTEYVGELHKFKTKCVQCKAIIQRVRSLLDEIKAIRQNDIIGVCEYCKQANQKNEACKRCHFIVSKFVDIHRRRCAEREQRFKMWLCKVKNLLQALVDSDSVCQHREYKDAELERILQELKGPLSMREPEIDFFPSFNIEKLSSLRSLSQSKEMLEELLFKIKRAGEKRLSDDSLYPAPSKPCLGKHMKDGLFDGEFLGLRKEMSKLSGDLEAQGEFPKEISQSLNQEVYKKMIKRAIDLGSALPQRWYESKESVQSLLATLNFAINNELSKDITHKLIDQLKDLKNALMTQDFTKYLKGDVIMGLSSDLKDLLALKSSKNLDKNLLQLLIDLTEMLADELSKNIPKDQSQLLLKSVQEDIAQVLFQGKEDLTQVLLKKTDASTQEPLSTQKSLTRTISKGQYTRESSLSKDVLPNSTKTSPKLTSRGSAKALPKVSPGDSPREVSKDIAKAAVKQLSKDTKQGSLKSLSTLKDSPQGSPKSLKKPTDSRQSSPKVLSKDPMFGAAKGLSKDPMLSAAKGPSKGPMHGVAKLPPKVATQSVSKGPPKETRQSSGKGPQKDSPKDTTQGYANETKQGSPKGRSKSPMHGAAKALSNDPTHGGDKATQGYANETKQGSPKGRSKSPMHGAAKALSKDPTHGGDKALSKDNMPGAAKSSQKDTMHGAAKSSHKDAIHGAAKGSHKDTMHGAAKAHHKDPMHGTAKAPPKDSMQGVTKASPKDFMNSAARGSPKDATQVSTKGQPKDKEQGSTKGQPKDKEQGLTKGQPKDKEQGSTKGQPKDKQQGLTKGPKETKSRSDKALSKEGKRGSDKPIETKQDSGREPTKESKQTAKGSLKHPMHGTAKGPPKASKDANNEKQAEKSQNIDQSHEDKEFKKGKERGREGKDTKEKEIPLAISTQLNKELVKKLQDLKKEYDNEDLSENLTKEINAVLMKTVEVSPPELNTRVINELSNLCDKAVTKVPKPEDVEIIRNFIKDCLKSLRDEPNKKEAKALLAYFNKALIKGPTAAKRQSKDIGEGKSKDDKKNKQPQSAIQKALQNRTKNEAKKDEQKNKKTLDGEGGDSGEKDPSKKKAQQPNKLKGKKDKPSKEEKEKENLSPEKKDKDEKPKEDKLPKKPPDRVPKQKKISEAVLHTMLKGETDKDPERYKLLQLKQAAKEKELERQRIKALSVPKKTPPVKKKLEVVVVPPEPSDILVCPAKKDHSKYMVKGTEIANIDSNYKEQKEVPSEALYFKTHLEFPQASMIDITKPENERGSSFDFENSFTDGIIRYRLSNREFIDKGWTKLPTKKIMRRMNIYKMEPVNPKHDWFERHKNEKELFYDSGNKLADIDDNGRGHWYYRNGGIALDYYNAEESNIGQRYVVYSSGEENENGRVKPVTVLGLFDVLGNGIVYDLFGNVRLKYNQSEGILVDPKLGPPGKWKWHTLNDPPVLQQVFVNACMNESDLELLEKPPSTEDPNENFQKEASQEMLSIELDNFVKEKATKLMQKFKPFQIRMKAVKLNDQFSLKIFDQANIHLLFRDGTTSLKINLGRLLKSDEIIDTDTSDMTDVATPYDKHPPRTGSVENIQKILKTVRTGKVRT